MFFKAAVAGLVMTITLESGEVVRVVVNPNRKDRGAKLRAAPLRVGVEGPKSARIEVAQFTVGETAKGVVRA